MNNKTGDQAFSEHLAAETVKRTDKLGVQAVDMALQVKQAREFLEWSAMHFRGLWQDWLKEADEASAKMNLWRMAFDRESKSVTATAKDIRDFFNSPDYIAAHDRLREMVTMLDRFDELKHNGTLDAFSDFILKVSCSSPSKT